VGFSNGGGMTSTFALLHASLLAGIAPVSGGWDPGPAIPKPDAPLPVWIWRGTAETLSKGVEGLADMDLSQTLFWTGVDGDQAPPQHYDQPPYTTSIYRGGQAEVRSTRIDGAGHDYHPGTSEKIWNGFFALFSRQGKAIVYHPPKKTGGR
jgi:poly(3-hydroxybutyrate) depolymerase